MSIEGMEFARKQPPNVQPVVGRIVISVDQCSGKGKPVEKCECPFCKRK